ncbi:MAG TPA: hypothetical protein PKA02_01840 [Candidatus Saccharibacteria bacterium]|nr:hypothetical protein [Candidatus Saccharibacteria bacterium]
MTGKAILRRVKELDLPKGEYIVFGSCPMALAEIRESSDVDLLVSKELFSTLEKSGWKILNKGPGDKPLTSDIFEAHYAWNFSSYTPTLEGLLSTATIVEGIPFASLEEVRKWKQSSGRPKDLVDIKLIDNYLEKKS